VDVPTPTLVGVLIGGAIGLAGSVLAQRYDRQARALDRKYERLREASQLLRLSVIQAARLHQSRTVIARLLDVRAWPAQRWSAFGELLARAGSALALVVDEIPKPIREEYEAAAQALFESWRADDTKLSRYVKAALDLRRTVEDRARSLR